jgi:hypothetical protein
MIRSRSAALGVAALAALAASAALAQSPAQRARIAQQTCMRFILDQAASSRHDVAAGEVTITPEAGAGRGSSNRIRTTFTVDAPTVKAQGVCVALVTSGLNGHVAEATLEFIEEN